METDNRIERTIGLVLLAVLAIGCLLVLRPFFTAVCFALILVVATWPAFERLRQSLGGRRTLAALLMVALATLVFVAPPALVAASVDYNVAATVRLVRDLSQHGRPPYTRLLDLERKLRCGSCGNRQGNTLTVAMAPRN
jgi:predicted PurR-regulated permease PerM